MAKTALQEDTAWRSRHWQTTRSLCVANAPLEATLTGSSKTTLWDQVAKLAMVTADEFSELIARSSTTVKLSFG